MPVKPKLKSIWPMDSNELKARFQKERDLKLEHQKALERAKKKCFLKFKDLDRVNQLLLILGEKEFIKRFDK